MVTSKKVTTNFTCLVTSVLGQYVTRGPPVGHAGHAGLRRDECREKTNCVLLTNGFNVARFLFLH
jgi:hypothetical protein